MSDSKRVDLDMSRLLGFRLQRVASCGGKVGVKPPGGPQSTSDVLLGSKVGGKVGAKPLP
ncbi:MULTISPECIES: hypothetical protein [unclassified Thioalkalivibrio]|uniref:hypothetical protein n=1 Tax=unclassified Thioalkalivibrio TaxID=2621013 RepID=UPI0003A609B7|nr:MULTISPECIES: hypothetical protein [unclassified Thioalkalivibrio]